jgi:hypothetical protein
MPDYSSGSRSRKARNLAADPRCVVATEDAAEPVVVEGSASLVTEPAAVARIAEVMNAKYGGITAEFLAANALIRVEPHRAFGIAHDDFTGSPTRWEFDGR